MDARRLRFVIGNNSSSPESPSYQVQSAIVHPGYVEGCEINDIAVVVLEEDVVDVQPLNFATAALSELPADNFTYVGYGFGRRGNASGVGVKRCADLKVEHVGDGSFLAPLGSENVCHGDSGGPALARTDKGYRLVGVTSWGDSDCRRRVVSTDVGASAEWIGKVSSDAARSRPMQRAALAQVVVEMIDPSSGDNALMNQVEPFPGFPYYSDASDNDAAWPSRAWNDRTIFGKKVKAYFVSHPYKGDGTVKLISSSPRDPDDDWHDMAARYMELRTLANLTLKGDIAALKDRIGKSAEG